MMLNALKTLAYFDKHYNPYLAGVFSTPPCCTAFWDSDDWVAYTRWIALEEH